MRHSTIDLTMNVYTDPKLLDVAGAVESLPGLPLGVGRKMGKPNRRKCNRHRQFDALPGLHQGLHQPPANRAYRGQLWTRRPTTGGKAESRGRRRKCLPSQEKRPADKCCQRAFNVGAKGFEPSTSWSQTRRASQLRHAPKRFQPGVPCGNRVYAILAETPAESNCRDRRTTRPGLSARPGRHRRCAGGSGRIPRGCRRQSPPCRGPGRRA